MDRSGSDALALARVFGGPAAKRQQLATLKAALSTGTGGVSVLPLGFVTVSEVYAFYSEVVCRRKVDDFRFSKECYGETRTKVDAVNLKWAELGGIWSPDWSPTRPAKAGVLLTPEGKSFILRDRHQERTVTRWP